MEIKLVHLSAEEAWDLILKNHYMYHNKLKHFNQYTYNFLIPDDKQMREMSEQQNLTPEQVKYYHDIFVNEIYNIADLKAQDENIHKAIPHFQKAIEKHIEPLLHAWNAKLPDTLTILCTYGDGAGYYNEADDGIISLRLTKYKGNDYGIYLYLIHEFVHILIEQQIIKKYNVPQDLKERIVDIICLELFKKPVHDDFINLFVDKYITPEAIKTDLPGAVQKMMADDILLQQKQNSAVRK